MLGNDCLIQYQNISPITEPLFPRGEPTVMNDVIVSSAMRTENQKIGDLANLNSLGSLASTFPDLRQKNSLLSAKDSLFRCVGNSASKPLSFLTDWTSKSAAEASFSQIPCSFPC